MTYSTSARRSAVVLSSLTAAMLLGLGLAPAALAHSTLTDSSPEDGAKLDKAPEKVTLTFNEDVGTGSNTIAVTGPEGTEYQRGSVDVDGDTASIALKPLPKAGEYTVGYRIISADGHPVEEEHTFSLSKEAIPQDEEGDSSSSAQQSTNNDESSTKDTSNPMSAYGPVGGAVVAIAAIALIVILIVRMRSRSGGGTG